MHLVGGAAEAHANQRRLPDVEALFILFLDQLAELSKLPRGCKLAPVVVFQRHSRLSFHDLKRVFHTLPNQRGAQSEMPLANVLPGRAEHCFRQLAAQNKVPPFR